MNKWLVVFAVLALLAVAGCAKKAPEAAPQTSPSTASAVSEFEQDLNEVDALESELDSSEVDSLDQDLASLG